MSAENCLSFVGVIPFHCQVIVCKINPRLRREAQSLRKHG